MPELTDADILAAVSSLSEQADLDDDQLNAVVLMAQRLIWPPSPYPFLHELPDGHISVEISEDGRSGELRCPHGCARAWRVNQAPDRQAVWDALHSAHTEYRTGRITSQAPAAPLPSGRPRIDLGTLLGRTVTIEVTDERITS